jgi:hypothetical protein
VVGETLEARHPTKPTGPAARGSEKIAHCETGSILLRGTPSSRTTHEHLDFGRIPAGLLHCAL